MFRSAFGKETVATKEEKEAEEEPFFLLKQLPMMFSVTQPSQREKASVCVCQRMQERNNGERWNACLIIE
jgi:hypothetical protein